MPSACVVQVIWQRPVVWSNRGMDVSQDVSSGRFKSLKVDRGTNAFGARRGQSVHTCRGSQSQWSSSESFIQCISLRWRSIFLQSSPQMWMLMMFNVIYWWHFVRRGLYKCICLPEWAKYAFRFLINKWKVCSIYHNVYVSHIHCLTKYPAGWEEVRGLNVSWQQHGTLWAGLDMNSWKPDSKKRRSVIPRHYWGFCRNFFPLQPHTFPEYVNRH